MKILFTNEGTYPYTLGGVSTWCDQLVLGLPHHQFHLLGVVGPRPVTLGYALPRNVACVSDVHLWRAPGPWRRHSRTQRGEFEVGLHLLLGFTQFDQQDFAAGLYRLAHLAQHAQLWSLFEEAEAFEGVRGALKQLFGRPARLAEIELALIWLKSTLAPLLFIPERADVTHTTVNGLAAIPAWIAAEAYQIPLVLTEHGLYLRERYLGFGADETSAGVKLLRARFYRTLAQLMYQRADLIVSVSEFNRSWQLELGAERERTRVIYNGVEPAAFPPAAEAPPQVPTVSWVGRIDPLKDLETLIRAFDNVRAVVPDALLRLFGPVPKGNEAYAKGLARLVAQLALERHVRFEGPVKPVHTAYHAADVVVLSSISEGFPYTPIEAMMCGKPVVATRVGGVAEAIGEAGRLVEPRNPAQLGQALTDLLLNPALCRQLGQAARERALELFTLAGMNSAYSEIYAQVVERHTLERVA